MHTYFHLAIIVYNYCGFFSVVCSHPVLLMCPSLVSLMWLLVHTLSHTSTQSDAPETSYCLLPDREYSVGRIGCDITTVWEQSISKKQSLLLLNSTDGTLAVKDVSTFGTFINGKRLLNATESIKEGDQFIFGLRSDISGSYTLRWRPVVLCCSQMGKSLLSLKASAIRSHITVVDTWDVSVTHLVVGELRTTQKVMCALARGVPIVDVSWVKSLIESINKLSPIPLPCDHLPTLSGACKLRDVTLFRSDLRRPKLFEGKRFYFLDSLEYQQLNIPISYCGGTSTLVDVSDVTFATFDRYASHDAVVVSGKKDRFCSVPGGTEFISSLELAIEHAGRALVLEFDVILSIVNVTPETVFSQSLPSSPLQASSNLSQQRNTSKQCAKKPELSQGATSCMFSLFDEENICQLDYPSSQPECKNHTSQLLPAAKHSPAPSRPSRLSKTPGETAIKCELSYDDSPSHIDAIIPFESSNAACHTPNWLSSTDSNPDNRDATSHAPSQLLATQEAVNEVKTGYRVLRKCFVKVPSLCSRKYESLKPFVRVIANSETLKSEPIPFSPDEEALEQHSFMKQTVTSNSSLTKSLACSSPKVKRKSSESIQTAQKRSLILFGDSSDSEDGRILEVTPLD